MRLVALGLAAGTILVTYEPVWACSPPPCWAGYFTPTTGTTVPSNIPALYWQPLHGQQNGGNDVQQVTLVSSADPETPLPFTSSPVAGTDAYLITPTQPLVEGTTYTLGDANMCLAAPEYPAAPTSVFLVGPSAAMPSTLGAVTVTDAEVATLNVPTSSGSCTFDVQADRATLSLELSADALPWRDALHIETLVDGQPWESRTLVYRVCHSDDPGAATGLAAGSHEVSMRATLPGTDIVLATAAVTFSLDCPGDPGDPDDGAPSEDGGCSTSGGAGGLVLLAALGLARRRRYT